jgi:hypothetical protein
MTKSALTASVATRTAMLTRAAALFAAGYFRTWRGDA